jgi:hypothetical protein
MSMLKTLQSTPGVITLFHSSKQPAMKLLNTLVLESNPTSPPNQEGISASKRSLWSYISKGKQESQRLEKYQVEDIKDQLPTYDQLKLIRSFVVDEKTKGQQHIFSKVFPQFVKDGTIIIPEELGTIELRNETFTQLVQEGVFNPPLVVDWDLGKIANDERSLQQLLKSYIK